MIPDDSWKEFEFLKDKEFESWKDIGVWFL